jgi:ketosteroid isomerase-like protein
MGEGLIGVALPRRETVQPPAAPRYRWAPFHRLESRMLTRRTVQWPWIAILLALPVAVTPADTPNAADDPLLSLEAERFRLTAAADVEAVGRLLDDDLSYCHTTGRCETKAEYLANLRSGRTKYHKIDVLGSRVRHYGDIAILNGQISIDVEAGGQSVKGLKMSYTDVYRKTQGRWRMVAWHSSPLP